MRSVSTTTLEIRVSSALRKEWREFLLHVEPTAKYPTKGDRLFALARIQLNRYDTEANRTRTKRKSRGLKKAGRKPGSTARVLARKRADRKRAATRKAKREQKKRGD